MEKRINKKISDHINDYKTGIKSWVEQNEDIDFNTKSNLLKFIYDFDGLSLNKDDFLKRRRVKSVVPQYLRCTAKKADGSQCTRKKKDDACYCGTHDKNRPHGIMDKDEKTEKELKKVEIYLQEINGIMYYVDKQLNVYKTEDILANKTNPNIIAKYKDVGGTLMLN